jgi:hypothetical protein
MRRNCTKMFGYDTIFVIAVQACCQGLLFDLAGEETAVFLSPTPTPMTSLTCNGRFGCAILRVIDIKE